MSTRLYFSTTTVAPASFTPNSLWSAVDSMSRWWCHPDHEVLGDTRTGLLHSYSVGSYCLDRQMITGPFAAQTFINSRVSMQLMAREFNNGDNSVPVLGIRVVKADGTDRGICLPTTKWFQPTVEFINNATMRNHAWGSGTALTSVTAEIGDRLVIEVGFGDNAGATPQAQARYGDIANPNISDLPQNLTQTTSGLPWIEFTSNFSFSAEAAPTTNIVPLILHRTRMMNH